MQGALPLSWLARIAIRKSLPTFVTPQKMVQNIDSLQLPFILKEFLCLGGTFERSNGIDKI
jgi:hypothetical protein